MHQLMPQLKGYQTLVLFIWGKKVFCLLQKQRLQLSLLTISNMDGWTH
jgi:hypothetical protein